MSPTKQVYPGITSPLSLEGPSERDIQLTEELEKTLTSYDVYDSEETAKLRERILKSLDEITKEFVQIICKNQGYTIEQAVAAGGKAMAYGSYRLGVNAKDADIDVLCVFPKNVKRDDFFDVMASLLEKNQEVTELTIVKNSFVPVLKFKYSGIYIDFVCAKLNLERIPEDIDMKDSNILRGLDNVSIRSVNGVRVADDILSLVPNPETFKTTLRCIKLWANQKAIYSNVVGFFGGVAWAITVARVCQLYPNASPSTLVNRFFYILKTWSWPSPVMLRLKQDGPPLSGITPWNARASKIDRGHLMPILTPSYPSMCTTHNVTLTTQRVIMGELKAAAETVQVIIAGNAPWSKLLEPRDFFKIYSQYLQIVAFADSEANLLPWSGLVEARLRQLVSELESDSSILQAHPYTDGFNARHYCKTDDDVALVSYGKAPKYNVQENGAFVYTKTFYIGLYVQPYDPNIDQVDLGPRVEVFKQGVKNWEGRDITCTGIQVQPIVQSDLPMEVFESNEEVKLT